MKMGNLEFKLKRTRGGKIITDYFKFEDEYVELFTRDQTRGFEVTRGPEARGLRRIRGFGQG